MRIRTQLFSFITILVLSLISSSFYLFSSEYRNFALKRLEEVGRYILEDIASESVDHLFYETFQTLGDLINTKKNLPDIEKIIIYDRNERVVTASDPSLIGEELTGCSEGITQLENELCFISKIEYSGQFLGVVQILISKERINNELLRSTGKWITLQLMILAAYLIVLFLALNRFLSPLRDMQKVAEAVSDGDFSVQVKESRSLELKRIALAMNNMSRAVLLREQQNLELKDYLINMINSISPAIFGVDRSGTIHYWNRKVNDFLNRDLSWDNDLKGKVIYALDLKFDLNQAVLEQAIKSEDTSHFENLYFYEDEELQFAEMKVFPLISEKQKGAVLLIENISEKKRYEGMMLQNEKMLTIGGMAAGMAHEINNPLSGILQNTELLNRRLFSVNTQKATIAKNFNIDLKEMEQFCHELKVPTYISYIMESCRRIGEIINNMLNFARHEDSAFSKIGIHEILEQTLILAKNDINRPKAVDFRQIEIEKEFCNEELVLYCQPQQIVQVVLNLLKNSAEAMFGTGRTPRIRIICRKDDRNVYISLEDNGSGIPEEALTNIFTPFFTTKAKGEGTGLGMFISQRIIKEIHSGDIRVESDGASYTRFTLMLPLIPGAGTSGSAEP
ncbi:MAG: HAMP domain-containing protein [Spirochaetales bacterium]|nr:HAMP domain-containing protein [Spirochaetales bacterium]